MWLDQRRVGALGTCQVSRGTQHSLDFTRVVINHATEGAVEPEIEAPASLLILDS